MRNKIVLLVAAILLLAAVDGALSAQRPVLVIELSGSAIWGQPDPVWVLAGDQVVWNLPATGGFDYFIITVPGLGWNSGQVTPPGFTPPTPLIPPIPPAQYTYTIVGHKGDQNINWNGTINVTTISPQVTIQCTEGGGYSPVPDPVIVPAGLSVVWEVDASCGSQGWRSFRIFVPGLGDYNSTFLYPMNISAPTPPLPQPPPFEYEYEIVEALPDGKIRLDSRVSGTIEVSASTIPTLSEWGMIILGLSLLAAGTVAVLRRRKAIAMSS